MCWNQNVVSGSQVTEKDKSKPTCVADPKAWPKSMPIMPPVSILIMKLERCRSPMPRTQWLTHRRAWEVEKWERRDRKASGVRLIFRNALLKEITRPDVSVVYSGQPLIWIWWGVTSQLTLEDLLGQAVLSSWSCWQCRSGWPSYKRSGGQHRDLQGVRWLSD